LQVRGGIVNWGSSYFKRNIAHDGVFNPPDCVKNAINKLSAFKCLEGHVPIPEWTEEREEAVEWLQEGVVVARQSLTGHSGEGLVIIETMADWVEAPLYVKYIQKKHEYRAHVFRDRVFFIQRKARNKDVPDEKVNWKVRNHGNGFIFAHKDVDVCEEAKRHAIMAVDKLGLDFGAVDLIWNEKKDKYYVIEVNTACGLEGTTLEKYVEVFKEFV
jgi:glutathione synthase/RimK-type ligase-like ATP-grasp enzyme